MDTPEAPTVPSVRTMFDGDPEFRALYDAALASLPHQDIRALLAHHAAASYLLSLQTLYADGLSYSLRLS